MAGLSAALQKTNYASGGFGSVLSPAGMGAPGWGAGTPQKVAAGRGGTPVKANPYRYKPYVQPTTVPPGTYDPGLDAQLGSAGRGLQDLASDSALQQTRADSDYALAQANIGNTWLRSLENRNTATAGLQHSTQLLGDSQDTRAAAAGFGPGDGTGLASALARAANQRRAQAPIDTGFQRTQADLERQRGTLDVNYQRGVQDRQSALARAQRENVFYGQDVNAAKVFQSTQSGLYTPPVKPVNEHTGAGGQVFRTAKLGHAMVYIAPNGSVRAGPPGTKGWNIAVNAKTGAHAGAIR